MAGPGGNNSNQVNTVFTGEARLDAARRELQNFTTQWTKDFGKAAEALSRLDQQALKTIQNFNKVSGQIQKFEDSLNGARNRPKPDRMGATNRRGIQQEAASQEADLFAYRKRISRALAGTVVEIDAEIKKLDQKMAELGRNRKKYAKEISEFAAERDRLTTTRRAVASNPYVAGELAGARTAGQRNALRQAAADDRIQQKAAEDLVRAKYKLLEVEGQLTALQMRGSRSKKVGMLAEERAALQDLIKQYEMLDGVKARAQGLTGRVGSSMVAGQAREVALQARQHLQAEQRVEEIKARMALHDAGAIKMGDVELAQLRAELLLTEKVLHANQADERVMERVVKLRERAQRAASGMSIQDQNRRTRERITDPSFVPIQASLMVNYAVLSGMQQAAMAVTQYVVQFESAMAQFQAIAAASDVETARVAQTIQTLGQNTKFTNLQIAEAATLLAQAGLSARDTAGALESIAQLATAAGTDLRQAADVVTSVATIWGYSVGGMAEIADILTSALNLTKLSMDQMQLGIQYAANASADAGIDFKELTSALGAMAQAGIKSGSTLGTGLRSLIVEFETPTTKLAAKLREFGLTIEDVNVRSLGLTQVLSNLKNSGFTAADAFGAFEIRAAAAYTALSNNLDVMTDLQGRLGETGAAADANAVQMDTLAAKWTQFLNVMLAVGGDALQPTLTILKALLTLATSLAQGLAPFAPVLRVATTAVVAFGVSLAAVKVASLIGGLLGLTGAIAAEGVAATGAAAGTGLLSRALTLLNAHPIIAAISGLAALAAVVIEASGGFDSLQKKIDRIDGSINEMQSSLDESRQAIQNVDEQIGKLTRSLSLAADNPIMKERLLRETQERFVALGLKVGGATDSVQRMIDALKALRTELSQRYQTDLLALADELRLKVQNLQRQAAAPGGLVKPGELDPLRRAVGGTGYSSNLPARRVVGTRGQGSDLYSTELASRYRDRFDVGLVTGVASGDARYRLLDEDGRQTNSATHLNEELSRLSALVRELTQKALKISADNPNEAKRLREDALRLQTLMNGARQQQGRVNGIASDSDRAADYQRQAELQPILNQAIQTAQQWWTSQGFEEMRRQALKDTTISEAERTARLKEIDEKAKAAIDAFTLQQARKYADDPNATDINQSIKGLLEDLRGGLRQGLDIRDNLDQQDARAAGAQGRAGQRVEDDQEKLNRDVAQLRVDQLEAELRSIKAKIDNTGMTAEELMALQARAAALAAKLKELQVDAARQEVEARGYTDRLRGFGAPVANPNVRSGYGPRTPPALPGGGHGSAFHKGIDYRAAVGTPALATADGTVAFAGDAGDGYGNKVVIRHGDTGVETIYAHLSQILVKLDDTVTRGQKIALTGNTGASAAPHLHYGATLNGKPIDPATLGSDPRFSELVNGAVAQATTEVDTMLAEINDAIAKKLAAQQLDVLKTEGKRNDQELDFILSNMEALEGDQTQLEAATKRATELIRRNIEIAGEAFDLDPDNLGRALDPEVQRQRTARIEEAIFAAAEMAQKADAAYIASRDRGQARNVQAAQTAANRASSIVGTSETTQWVLNQRVQLAEYNALVEHRIAVETKLAEAIAARAAAELALSQASSDSARTEAQAALDRANARVAALQAEQKDATSAVTAGTPATPLYTGGNGTPLEMMAAMFARYQQTHGMFASITEQMVTGIEGAFDALGGGLENFITDITTGTKSVKQAFADMAKGVLAELQQMAAKMLANAVMKYLMQMMMSAFMGPSVGAPMPGHTMTMALGGAHPKRFAMGGADIHRDSQLALVKPGEVVMRNSAVEFAGRQNLLNINAMGNRRHSKGGAVMNAAMEAMGGGKPREPDMVNVWVVSPQNVPPPGPKDIIHIVGQNLSSGGELKKLVRQVAVGR